MDQHKYNNHLSVIRLRLVLAVCYGNNASAMAKDLGWDRSTLSRILSGELLPAKRLLIALARSKRISQDWLEGRGTEEEIQFVATESDLRPVVSVPSDSVPIGNEQGLNRQNRETAPFHNRQDRYWLIAGKDYEKHAIRKGDYLLIRVFPKCSAKEVDAGKLFVFKRGNGFILEEVTNDAVLNGMELVGKVVMVERDLD